jgi:ribosomal protein L30E
MGVLKKMQECLTTGVVAVGLRYVITTQRKKENKNVIHPI